MSTQKDQNDATAVRSGTALRRLMHRKLTWLLVLPVVLAMLGYGTVFAYVQYTNANAAAPLSFGDLPQSGPTPDGAVTKAAAPDAGAASTSAATAVDTASAAATARATASTGTGVPAQPSAAPPVRTGATKAPRSEVDGRWLVGSDSIAGYRMGYSAAGVRGTRVGRPAAGSKAVTGEFLISGTVLKSAKFSITMAKVDCDGGQQCTDHINEIMDVPRFPYEKFTLTKAVDLGNIPADGKQITVKLTGQLTLRGVTRTVSFPLTARRSGGRIEVLGSIPVNRDDYKIPESGKPGFDIDKDGIIELLLAFKHA